MTGKQLRTSILQEAIAGRLVSQDPRDEPACELLKKIRKEKEKLIKEGKLAKDKNETIIFRGDDKKFYEQKGKTVICIDDQIPSEIPDSWEWCRMGNIGDWGAGATPYKSEPKYYGGDILWLRTGELNNGVVYDTEIKITEKALKECSLRMNKVGDVLIAMYGATIGKLAIAGKDMTTNQACCACTPLGIYNYYLFYFLMASKADLVGKGEGGAQPNISKEKLVNHLIPIPPLAEQKRIVAKIEELMPLVDEYEKAQEEFDNLNAGLKSKFRASLLQEAISGRLVPQDPSDEPASELLKRINPKATLIQGNVPFDVPGNWAWCRLGNICDIARGGSPRPIKKYLTGAENGVNWIKIGDTKPDDKYVRSVKQKIKPEGVSRSRFVHKGDFLLTNSMSFGRPYILDVDGCIHDGWLVISPKGGVYDKDFLYYLLSSPFAYEQFSRKAGGGVVDNLNSEKVSNTVFPLPPLAEQKRIVEKLESMFAVLDKLEVSCN